PFNLQAPAYVIAHSSKPTRHLLPGMPLIGHPFGNEGAPLCDRSASAFTSFWAGETYQAFALSTFSNAMTTARTGVVPESAVILSVRTMYCPPAEVTDAT